MADLPDVTQVAADEALAAIWHDLGLPRAALARAHLVGADPVFESSFAVATAAQAAIAGSALAATEIAAQRAPMRSRLTVTVDIADAARECTGAFTLDGATPPVWDRLSGLYRCGRRSDPDRAAGWIRIHANFAHHRDGAIRLLGLGDADAVTREAVEHALADWRAEDVEDAADEAGLVIAALRTQAQWDAHPQAKVVAGQPLITIERIGDCAPLPWPAASGPSAAPSARRDAGLHDAPLAGLRVLDLTRVLAGPVACRTLAVLGADVLTVHSPGLLNIAALPDTSRGKRSATIAVASDPEPLRALLGDADVFFQAARPGAIAALGFGPQNLHRIRPGIIAVDLDAWGDQGPWGGKRGFDSLVQTATGLNDAERIALGRESPQPLPVQILDYATGFLAALGTQAALLRQRTRGGSWRVHVSLARTAHWLRSLGRYRLEQLHEPGRTNDRASDGTNDRASDRANDRPGDRANDRPGDRASDRPGDRASIAAALRPFPSDFGALRALPHAARFSRPWPASSQPSRPPGSDPPAWW